VFVSVFPSLASTAILLAGLSLGGGDYPWVANLDGQPAFGARAELRQVEKFWRKPSPADAGVRLALADLLPRFDVERAMAQVEDRRMGLDRLVLAFQSDLADPEADPSAFVLEQLTIDPFSVVLNPENALTLVRVMGDSRRQVRTWLLEEGRVEARELRSAFALLDTHTHGLGRLDEPGVLQLVTARLDLAAVRMRAILVDLEVFQEGPGQRLFVPNTEAVRLAQAFVMGEREAGSAWSQWVTSAKHSAGDFASGTQLASLDKNQAATLALRTAGRNKAAGTLIKMRELAPADGTFGVLLGSDGRLSRFERCQAAIRLGLEALSQDPFAAEVHQITGISLDFTRSRPDAVVYLDRYLHLVGIRFYDSWTVPPRGRSAGEEDALLRVLSPS
jgi:hypothetical protein